MNLKCLIYRYVASERNIKFLLIKFVVKYLKTFPNKKSKTGPPSWLLLFKDRPKIFKITKNLELFLLRCEASLRVSKVEDMQEEIRKRSSFSAVVR